MVSGSTALLIAYGGAHVNMVAPVMRRLEEAGVRCVLMALTTGFGIARRLGLEALGYRDFLHLVDDPEQILAWGRELSEGNEHPDVDAHETYCYLGINFADWVATEGYTAARERFQTTGRRGFLPHRFARRLLDYLNPSIVVATCTPRTEQACIEAALDKGIPTLTMLDLFGMPGDAFVARPRHADRIAVLNEFVRANLLAAGISSGRVVCTGNPAFDAIADPIHLSKAQDIRERLGWHDLRVVMWAGQVHGAYASSEWAHTRFSDFMECALREWVKQTPGFALAVRHHPNEFQYFTMHPPQDRVFVGNPRDESLHAWLCLCDTMVVENSTVGLEAALMGSRVIVPRFSPVYPFTNFQYDKGGIAIGVDSMSQLLEVLRFSNTLNQRSRMREFHVGDAAQRVANEVLKLLSPVFTGDKK